jgi:putative ABC transport system permease protein
LAPTLDLWNLLAVSLLVIGIAIVASLQPAAKAARMEPIDALRHV